VAARSGIRFVLWLYRSPGGRSVSTIPLSVGEVLDQSTFGSVAAHRIEMVDLPVAVAHHDCKICAGVGNNEGRCRRSYKECKDL
jgi:hypothetical protein